MSVLVGGSEGPSRLGWQNRQNCWRAQLPPSICQRTKHHKIHYLRPFRAPCSRPAHMSNDGSMDSSLSIYSKSIVIIWLEIGLHGRTAIWNVGMENCHLWACSLQSWSISHHYERSSAVNVSVCIIYGAGGSELYRGQIYESILQTIVCVVWTHTSSPLRITYEQTTHQHIDIKRRAIVASIIYIFTVVFFNRITHQHYHHHHHHHLGGCNWLHGWSSNPSCLSSDILHAREWTVTLPEVGFCLKF